jgi:hypothetical protein
VCERCAAIIRHGNLITLRRENRLEHLAVTGFVIND